MDTISKDAYILYMPEKLYFVSIVSNARKFIDMAVFLLYIIRYRDTWSTLKYSTVIC